MGHDIPDADRFEGCLLGLMAGDALGLPRERLSRRRGRRLFGDEIRHDFLLGHGMASDDTEHACMVGQSLLRHPSDPDRFLRGLAWKLRLWLLGLPAGIGRATLHSCLKLWLGVSPRDSGVRSAGNGPAMRSPVIGVFFSRDADRLRSFTRASTRLTHAEERAERGALAVALAARYAATHDRGSFSREKALAEALSPFPDDDGEARRRLEGLRAALAEGWDEETFFERMGFGDGVSGYIYDTVTAALWAWLVEPFDFRGGMGRALRLGGDADTVGAVYGAVCGAATGAGGIPREWLAGIWDYPRTVGWVRGLARGLHSAAAGTESGPLPLAWPWLGPRNAVFLCCVLLHGLRRLLPPY